MVTKHHKHIKRVYESHGVASPRVHSIARKGPELVVRERMRHVVIVAVVEETAHALALRYSIYKPKNRTWNQ